jgi:excisionase family DNA binding protein
MFRLHSDDIQQIVDGICKRINGNTHIFQEQENLNKIEPELLTISEAADVLRVNHQTIYRWIGRGFLNSIRLGKRAIRISADEVETIKRCGINKQPCITLGRGKPVGRPEEGGRLWKRK